MVSSKPDFGDQLNAWGEKWRRPFPWRKTNNPFHIFLAEILLHRTRAENVVPVYQKLIKDFPTISGISKLDEKSLFNILSSLGLKWRTEMLIKSVRTIERDFGGDVPTDKQKLLSLPGIGDYIASAIRVFSASTEDPLIDTNTVRVISRVYGFKATDSTRRSKSIRYKYLELRNNKDPRNFGFSMIDLAALICKPSLPDCLHCPVVKYCITGCRNIGLND
ncbi:MAG: DNA glycosylase [Thermoplasmatales archaeon]